MDGWKSPGGVKYRAAYAANKQYNHHHLPLAPHPSAGQSESTGCQNLAPVVESRTQARLSQPGPGQCPQQQSSAPTASCLQLSASRFVHELPGEARLHSDKNISVRKICNQE